MLSDSHIGVAQANFSLRHVCQNYSMLITYFSSRLCIAQPLRYEAMQMYRHILIQLKNGGMNDTETASTCTKLAKLLEEQGSREDAMVIFQKALEIQLATLGNDHQVTVATYCNITVVLNFLKASRNKG